MSSEASVPETSARPLVAQHRIHSAVFDVLAGGVVDEHAVSVLAASERSRRLLSLRAVLDRARATPGIEGPLATVDTAWDVLARAEDRDPTAVRDILSQPPVGNWAGHLLRRLHGGPEHGAPLWVDLGYLHTVAAAAAVRCGLDVRIRVPVRQGTIALPTLGHVRLPTRYPWETAEVVGDGQGFRCEGSGGTSHLTDTSDGGGLRWRRRHHLRAETAGLEFSVPLEDSDPFRHILRPSHPAPLPASAIRRWQETFTRAWSLLATDHRELATSMPHEITMLAPLAGTEPHRQRSASGSDAFGGVLLSEPAGSVELAVTLVHEAQHAKLGALMHLVDLFDHSCQDLFYAPWRPDPRPIGGFFHGVYAFFGVTDFWQRRRLRVSAPAATVAHFEFALWRQRVNGALQVLQDRDELTGLGRRFLRGLRLRMDGWLTEPVPADCQRLADAAAADHHATWRINHLRPAPTDIEPLAQAWMLRPERPPVLPAASLRPLAGAVGDASTPDSRAMLLRLWLTDRDRFRELQHQDRDRHGVPGAVAADLAYFAGDLEQATDLYLADLAAGPERAHSWAGLGLVAAATGDTDAARALHTRPELVVAVARAVAVETGRLPPPLPLARWIGRAAGDDLPVG